MKNAKIILLGITIMAVLAGVLAFNAKIYGQLFCTRLIEHGPGVCEGPFIGKIDQNQFTSFYYTLTNNPNACAQTLCGETTFLTNREP